MTPKQLQARVVELESQRAELLTALRELRHAFRPSEEDYDPVWYPDIAKADAVLAKYDPCDNG